MTPPVNARIAIGSILDVLANNHLQITNNMQLELEEEEEEEEVNRSLVKRVTCWQMVLGKITNLVGWFTQFGFCQQNGYIFKGKLVLP